MSPELKKLVEETMKLKMSPKDMEEQRRSFAFGNANIENSKVTREIIDQEAEALNRSPTPTC